MKMKRVIAMLSAFCMTACMCVGLSGCQESLPEYVDVYVTTGTMSKLLARQTSLKFTEYGIDQETDGTSIVVDVDKKGQVFYGYGASLTHSAAYLLTQEGAEATTDEMLQELFGEDGARLSLVRVPIGASDYIEGDTFFTCDDLDDKNVDTDMSLEYFNIDHDTNIITILKKIIAINPDVQILACPWSAPAWMKENGSLEGSTLKEDCYEVYADYLVKFVEAYKAEGIEIDYLSLINEPLIRNCGYPHMDIDELQAVEIGRYLNEKFGERDLDVSLLCWEHNVDDMAYDYLDTVLGTKENAKLFAGVALHGYGDVNEFSVSEGMQYISESFPGNLSFLTEITEHSGSNDFASNLSYAARYSTVEPINHGMSGMLMWNLVLRSDGSPTPVRHGNECYGVMDIEENDGEFSYFKRSGYYAMAQTSKFAYAIDGEYPVALSATSSNDAQILASALYRADGTIVVTAVNISDQLSETVHLVIDGQCVSFELMPQSVVTFVC